MKNRKLALPILAMIGVIGMLGTVLLLPGDIFAWNQCTLGNTMLVGDIAAAPNGTLYAIIASPDNHITVVKFQSGSCSKTTVPNAGEIAVASQADVDKSSSEESPPPISPEGPIEAFDPKIAVSPSGDVVITYREAGGCPCNVFFQRKPAGANSFGNPVTVTTNGYVGGIALDNNNNVHIVWYRTGNAPGGFYRKYGANNQLLLGGTKKLTSFGDAEPEVAVDSGGNAHVVFMAGSPDHNDIHYRRIKADGTVEAEKDIANTGGHSIFPDISVDINDQVDIAWQGRPNPSSPYEPYYRHCNNGATSCGAQQKLATTSTNVAAVDVTSCGSGPYVSFYDKDTGSNAIYTSTNLGSPKKLTNGTYNASDIAAGAVHLLFRDANGKAAYAWQADSTCIGPGGGQPQPTNTPTTTATATNGPPPPSATPTLTPPSTTKQRIDDKNAAITYAPQGGWSKQNGGPSCLFGGGFHYASGPGKTATYTFTGIKVKYWYLAYNTFGTAQVLIDGQVVGTVNERDTDAKCKFWSSPLLPRKQHTIQIRPKSGGNISLDLLVIFP